MQQSVLLKCQTQWNKMLFFLYFRTTFRIWRVDNFVIYQLINFANIKGSLEFSSRIE